MRDNQPIASTMVVQSLIVGRRAGARIHTTASESAYMNEVNSIDDMSRDMLVCDGSRDFRIQTVQAAFEILTGEQVMGR